MSKEAMKQALEALEYVKQTYDEQGLVSLGTNTAIIDLRQAIAEAEKQEPVAWWVPKAEQFCLQNPSGERPFAKAWEPLYTTPQQRTWVGLTDQEIKDGESKEELGHGFIQGALWAETKLKEKHEN
jgi:hypothetical protein